MLIESQIYVYPIKSVRSIKSMSAIATSHGFAHDRNIPPSLYPTHICRITQH